MSQTDPTAAQCEGLRPPGPVQSDLGQLEAYTAVFNIFPEPVIVGVEGKQEPFPSAFWSPVVTHSRVALYSQRSFHDCLRLRHIPRQLPPLRPS